MLSRGGGDAALGPRVFVLAFAEGGETLRGLRQRAAVGSHDALLRGQRGEITSGGGFGHAELAANVLQRGIGVVAKVIREPVAAGFDDVLGDLQAT